MDDHELAAKLLQDHFTATAALIALMLRDLPGFVRERTLNAVRNGTGKVELRTRVESNETELVLVATNGSEVLWLTKTRGPKGPEASYETRIWNRACTAGCLPPNAREGDRALAYLLQFHGLAMNGGVNHAVECCDSLDGVVAAYRYFGLGEAATFIASVPSQSSTAVWEAMADKQYAKLVLSDEVLEAAFRSVLRERPGEFAAP